MSGVGAIVVTDTRRARSYVLMRYGLTGWGVVGRYGSYSGARAAAERLGLTLTGVAREAARVRAARRRVRREAEEGGD